MVNFHPLHLELHQEIHARPYPKISAPCAIGQIAFYRNESDISDEYQLINDLANTYQVNGVANEATSYFEDFGSFCLRWEGHREFSTITVIKPVQDNTNFTDSALKALPNAWIDNFPGQGISANTIFISDAKEPTDEIETYLGGRPRIASHLLKRQATVWTNLLLDEQGFTKFYLQVDSSSKGQLGRIVLKLLEIETYRQMALLGLPLAKQISPVAASLGQDCADIIKKMTQLEDAEDEQRLLQSLMDIAAQVENERSNSSYRFSATKAYTDLVSSRLEELEQERVTGKEMLGEFLQRRFMPAVRTCGFVQTQLESLSKRLTSASDLLRTRVDQTIANQNKKLLESMNRRSRLQLRLQQTVEGLSVAAISYYLISLVKIILHSFSEEVYHINENLVLVILAPVIFAFIYIVVRNYKKHYAEKEE